MNYLRMIVLLALSVCTVFQVSYAEMLPVCSNRTIAEVTTRTGCTIGDSRCWLTKGGFCTDYVESMASRGRTAKASKFKKIKPQEVKKGDIAKFDARVHVAYVEGVVTDKNGKPVAVNVSEYNYGACWVDEETMVTDKYKVVNRRAGISIVSVDGGFLRPISFY